MQRHDVLISRRQVVRAARQHVAQWFPQGGGQPAGEFGQRGDRLRGGIAHLMASVRIDHKQRVGRRRERRLHRAAGARHPLRHGVAIDAQLGRHRVERTGEFSEFVVCRHRHVVLQSSFAERRGGLVKRLDRTQQRPRKAIRKEKRQPHRSDRCRHEDVDAHARQSRGFRGRGAHLGVIALREFLESRKHAKHRGFRFAQRLE